MYLNGDPKAPDVRGGYVPYFYQRGLHYLYSLTASAAAYSPSPARPPGSEPSEWAAFSRAVDRTQTVEQIIQNGYFSIPASDPITAMIADQRNTSRMGLDDVISQIRGRYELYAQSIEQIQLAKCAAINGIYLHEAYCGPGSASSKQQYGKHKTIQKLYEQHRNERTSLWKDVSRLRLLLPETAQQYLSAHRKASVLASDPGDAA